MSLIITLATTILPSWNFWLDKRQSLKLDKRINLKYHFYAYVMFAHMLSSADPSTFGKQWMLVDAFSFYEHFNDRPVINYSTDLF